MTKRFSNTVRAAALLGALGLSACAPALGPFPAPSTVTVGGAVGGPVAVGGGWVSSPGAVAWGGAPLGWRRHHDPFWGPRHHWGPGWHRGPGWGHGGWHGRHWSHGPGWHGRKGFGGAGFGWRW